MDYIKHYNTLMTRSLSRKIDGYVERHHIIPKCIGGNDDLSNIAILTAREHYIAHLLLMKIYPNENKLIYSARMMTVDKNGERINNKLYEWVKIKYNQARKLEPKRKYNKEKNKRKERAKETKPRNRDYKMSEEQKKKISESVRKTKSLNNTISRLTQEERSIASKKGWSNKIDRSMTEEQKKKISESVSRFWSNKKQDAR